jgi:SOS-response transcriptional repressor LexA
VTGLTKRQAEVLALIEGGSPTYREIGAALGLASTNGVNDHIAALVKKGRVARAPNLQARSFRVLAPLTTLERAVHGLGGAPPVCPTCGGRIESNHERTTP